MYAHESTCTRCGDNFVVEVRPGDAMRPEGICNNCRTIERNRLRNRQILWVGAVVGVVLLVAFFASLGSCG